MQIISLDAVAFTALALVIYHLLPTRTQPRWLLLVSYAFYVLTAWRYTPVLIAITLMTFVVARRLERSERRRALWLWAGLAVNVAMLLSLRFAYAADPFAAPFAVIGLSFYSLQALSYLLDIYAGTLQPTTLTALALYLAYFPKLLAGPIERAGRFVPQATRPRAIDARTVARAGTLIVIGVVRKVVLADPLRALIPQSAFSTPGKMSAALLAGAIVGYAFVLYNDFAGYSSMARGVSALFGIELSVNFAQPFFARSFSEFWSRWHITLSHWLRDYIYLPLSRALVRRNPRLWNVPNLVLPPLVTMLACGLWHGGSAHMLVWGGLHGTYLAAERLFGLLLRRTPLRSPPLVVAAALSVFAVGCWTLVAFRLDLETAVAYWQGLLQGRAGGWPNLRMLWCMVPSLWLDWMELRHGADTAFDHWPRLCRAALLAVAILLCFLMTRAQPSAPFIYRGF